MPRLFIGIPVALNSFFASLPKDLDGIKLPHENDLHITLKFFGDVSADAATKISQELRNLRLPNAFSLILDVLGYFPDEFHPRIYWLGLSQKNETLFDLQSMIVNVLENVGFESEARAYVPHVTLARISAKHSAHVQKLKDLTIRPVQIFVDRICLYESKVVNEQRRYLVIEERRLHE